MSIRHTLTMGCNAGGSNITKSIVTDAEAEINMDVNVPTPSTNLAVDIALDISQLKSFYMVADRAMSVKTNSSGSPVDTITLAANKPVLWSAGGGMADLFSADVTKFYVSNAGSGAAGTLNIRALTDPTV